RHRLDVTIRPSEVTSKDSKIYCLSSSSSFSRSHQESGNSLPASMGTLTADVPRLAEHCPHKLPTSCRLTSTPQCCACADRRPHFSTYRMYIDGVGFVSRGTRWQSYCWFCKS